MRTTHPSAAAGITPTRRPSPGFATATTVLLLLAFGAARGLVELNIRWHFGSLEASFLPHLQGVGESASIFAYFSLWAGSIGLCGWRLRYHRAPESRLAGWLTIGAALGGVLAEVLIVAAPYLPDQMWTDPSRRWWLHTAILQTLWLPVWFFVRPTRTPATWRDLVREIGLLALGGALALIVTLGLWRLAPEGTVLRLSGQSSDAPGLGHLPAVLRHAEMTMAVCWLSLTPVLWWVLRRIRSAWSQAATVAATTAALLYLAWDDSSVGTLPPADALPPLTPPEVESAAVLRQMPPADPKLRNWLHQGGATHPEKGSAWRLFVVAHREAILADWSAPGGGVAWLERLDAFERLGDDTLQGQRSAPLQWQQFRDLAKLHAAAALLLTIDGRDDEALAQMRRLLAVTQKMQRGARSIVPFGTGTIVQAIVQPTVALLLEIGTFRPDALESFAASLQATPRPGDFTARIWQAELQTWVLPGLRSELIEYSLTSKLGPLRRLFYLPRATSNSAIAQYRRVAGVIEDGRGEERRLLLRGRYEPTFRNAIGSLMVGMNFPEFAQLLNTSWHVDDQRRDLLAKIQAKLAAGAAAPPRRLP